MTTHETSGAEAPISSELVKHTQETVTQMLQHWREVQDSKSLPPEIELYVGDDSATVRHNLSGAVSEIQVLRDSNGAFHVVDIGQRPYEPGQRGVLRDSLDTTIAQDGSRKLVRTIDSSNGEHREEVFESPVSVGDFIRCETVLNEANQQIGRTGWLYGIIHGQQRRR